jgi:hypothetical protein
MTLGRVAVCVGIWIFTSVGCASLRATDSRLPASREVVAEVLLPVSALRGNLLLRQRVTIRWKQREESFAAVLQKREDELLLVGLGPMNAVGFTLTLDERGVQFENRSGREMPFEPERILADVQRVFYPWIEADGRCTECERHATRVGLEVSERVGQQYLEERRFEDSSGARSGEIVIRFEDWIEDGIENGSIPGRAVLSNGWYGYELIVETQSVERLE